LRIINPEKKEERERVALSLLRATLELAATHGFSGLGLREASRAAGIAPTSFYRHFADMEELGLALIEGLVGRMVRELSDVEGAAELGGMLEAIMSRAFAAAAADPDLFRFILAERVGAIPSFREAIAGKLAILSRAIRGGKAVGDSDSELISSAAEDADAVVLLLLSACGDLLDHGPGRLPALRKRFRRQARRLLSPADESGST
jgi:AcrR family transcriptional regulator